MNDTRVSATAPASRTVIAELPARVIVFLRAIATHPIIRHKMHDGGFGPDDYVEGWQLLQRAVMVRDDASWQSDHAKARDAMQRLHEWLLRNRARYRAALERSAPEHASLFGEANPATPKESLLAVCHLLRRLDSDPTRANQALMALLTRRGLDTRSLEWLKTTAQAAQAFGDHAEESVQIDSRTSELTALYRWYCDWRETAHRMIERKDYRITLGISGRGPTRQDAKGATSDAA